jgi:hypothetical protein
MSRKSYLQNDHCWRRTTTLLKGTLVLYVIFNQGSFSQAKDKEQFINIGKHNLLFKGAIPIYTGDFN